MLVYYQPDTFTNSEAFLAGVSSCGVTLIEMHARERELVETYRRR